MSDFQHLFVAPILSSTQPDPGRFLAIVHHLAEAAALKALRDLRRLQRRDGGAA